MRAWLPALLALGCNQQADRGAPAAADAAKAAAEPAPPASAEALVGNNCLGCHGDDVLQQQRLTEKQWDAVVKKMQGWGAPIEPENVAKLVSHLAATYGTAAGPWVAPEIASAEAARAVEPTPDGAFAGGVATRGKAVYDAQCQSCHAPDARGGPMGVNLVDLWILYRAGDFVAVVRTGRGRMPAFKISDRELADAIAWLRGLRQEGT